MKLQVEPSAYLVLLNWKNIYIYYFDLNLHMKNLKFNMLILLSFKVFIFRNLLDFFVVLSTFFGLFSL